jgi:2-desacetyl-2-hydroxyethyl bacteriochlorophyllide A dehydrogenase
MRIDELPVPVPAPDEALVQIHAAGICGTDIEVVSGRHGFYLSGWAKFPIVPGHEWSGYVREVGSEVTNLKVGDLVSGETGIGCMNCELCLTGHHNLCANVTEAGIVGRDGAMREFHAQKALFVHKHGDVDPDAAALAEPATVAVYSCKKGGVTPHDRVAILGAGSIGQLTVQAARAFGARYVLATSRSRPKLELAKRLGADMVVNPRDENLREIALDVTDGHGFDVVIEVSGSMSALEDALDIAAFTGRIVFVGTYQTPTKGPLMQMITKELSLIGVRGSPHVYPETVDMMARGLIDTRPVISHTFALDQYAEAFEIAENGGPDVLKVLLKP